MKVSLNWIKEYLNFELPQLDELTQKIGAQLGAIEEVEDIGDKYKSIVIAKVVSIKDHPNADRLHIVMIDDGGVVKDVARDENGHIQIVCAAPNLSEGMMVPWLPPGTVVPETYGKEPFTLEAREMRGVVSNGMLASARELALGTDHTGIIDLGRHPRLDLGSSEKAIAGSDTNTSGFPIESGMTEPKPGDDFAKIYKLDDYIIDIENKMFTHRPDLFGELGVAREIAGILNRPFTSPAWYLQPLENPIEKGEPLPLVVKNDLPELVPRFMAVAMRIGSLGPSPVWLQTYLSRVGLRPINNVVDITNYMMMLAAQPLHAYDYDKVKRLSGTTPTLVVRYPQPNEKLMLLNGKEIQARAEAIMIATDKQLIGLGGVMGGADTEVDENTKNIILECATFDMYAIRRTSMASGIFTDAVTRFNKGQSPLQNDRVVGESMRLLRELAKATQAGDVVDIRNEALMVEPAGLLKDRDGSHSKVFNWGHVTAPVGVTASFINARLGTKLSAEEMCGLLRNVEISAYVEIPTTPDEFEVIAPFWRTDIELPEDVVEEVGRLYGYDKLPLDLPMRTIEPAKKDAQLELKQHIRETLAKSGANEVLTYGFVHGNLLDKVGQDKSQAFQLSNAISPDLQYYRLSLTPSLLDHVHQNIKAGYDEFALFEMGLIHHKGIMDEQDKDVALEDAHVALVFAADAKVKHIGAAYYEARKYVSALIAGVASHLVPLKDFDFKDDSWGRQLCAPYEPNRSAVVVWNDLAWGVVGEFKADVSKALKLPAYTAGFEVALEFIKAQPSSKYVPLPRFPKVEQDISLKVPADTTYQIVFDFIQQKVDELKPEQAVANLSPLDIYQREDDQAHKQITLRLSIASYEKTLTDAEVAKLLDEVAAAAKEPLNAERI